MSLICLTTFVLLVGELSNKLKVLNGIFLLTLLVPSIPILKRAKFLSVSCYKD